MPPQVWLGRWQETDVAIKQLGSLSALGVETGSLQHDSSGGAYRLRLAPLSPAWRAPVLWAIGHCACRHLPETYLPDAP